MARNDAARIVDDDRHFEPEFFDTGGNFVDAFFIVSWIVYVWENLGNVL